MAVVGDAGSGKSRLVYELKQRLAGEEHRLLRGALLVDDPGGAVRAVGGHAPAVLRHRCRSEAAAAARAKIADRIGDVDGELESWLPYLCESARRRRRPPATTGPPRSVKRRTFEAVAGVTGAAASSGRPVVMIIEDVHWIDEPSREMLAVAVVAPARGAVMILITPPARPPAAAGG